MTRERRQRALGISVWFREDRGYWTGDFRRYEDGGRERLVDPDGEPLQVPPQGDAVPVPVQRSVSRRLDVLEGNAPEPTGNPTLAEYTDRWFQVKDYAEASVQGYRSRLRNILRFYQARGVDPAELRLEDITTPDLNDFITWRRENTGVSNLTIQHDLVALQSLYSFAVNENAAGENPVDGVDLPKADKAEPEWLEIGEAAKLLKAAEETVEDPHTRVLPFMHTVVAVWLLTGLTRSEAFGLLVEDVDLEEGRIQVRPNEVRPLKNKYRKREVPIWDQLRPYLEEHLEERRAEAAPGELLFPSPRTGGTVTNPWKGFQECLKRAGLEDRDVTIHTLRHTYTATRLQCLDHGAPVSPYTVAAELGHQGLDMVERVYGHVQDRRQRLEEVRYTEADVLDLNQRRAG